jgi:hypothetical protein
MRWNKYVKDISINSNKEMLCCHVFSLFLNVYYLIYPTEKPNATPTSYAYSMKFLLEGKENIQ